MAISRADEPTTARFLALMGWLRSTLLRRAITALQYQVNLAHAINAANAAALRQGQLHWRDLEGLERHFLTQMMAFPPLGAVQLGNAAGEFVGCMRLASGVLVVELKDQRTGYHKYAYSVQGQRASTRRVVGISRHYDPRQRPWYRRALANQRAGWSGTYSFSSSVEPLLGVMATLPVWTEQGKVAAGVLGCDITLVQLSQLLATHGDGGVLFIVDGDGWLVASSSLEKPYRIQGQRAERLAANRCGDARIELAVEHLLQRNGPLATQASPCQLSYRHQGILHFVDLQPLRDRRGLKWWVGLAMDEATVEERLFAGAGHVRGAFRALVDAEAILDERVERRTAVLAKTLTALQRRESRWRLAIQGTGGGVWDWDLTTDEVFYSKQWKALLGFDDDEITPRLAEWHGRIHPDDRERVLKALADYRLGRALHYRCEYRLIGRDGGECWVRDQGQAARDELGEPLRLVGLTLDIGAQKRAELTLQRQAQHDALTLLPNRQHFVDCLRRACRSVAPTPDGSSFAVLFIDLDRFKIVNDSLGHDAGDRLLKMAADRLRRHLATTHLLARLGGDEFAVLVTPCGSADDALTLAGELIDALQAPFTLHNQRFDLSASIGVAMSRQADEPAVLADAAELLRRADLAMYRAKVQGSGQRVLYSAEMSVAASDRVHLEAELRRALGGGQQLQMFFQPIVQLEDGQVVGFEALLRWRHPRLGLLFPKTFLPIAEEAGLLGELGRFGLAKACEAMQQALITGALSPRTVMSVNASGADLCQPDWSQQVAGIVRRTGLPFDRLRIEVTESALAENSAEAPAQLTALKALGVEVAIDDFGTGYSSLERLLDLPVDVLKVDRSFVADIHTNTRRQRLVQAIIDFAHVLGLVVVAEGVEQLAHQRLLRAMGCECGQGYWFAPARPELSSEIGGVGGHAPVAPMDS